MIFIDSSEKLENFCEVLQKQDFITIDSEFIREFSYYPKLCLLQIGCEKEAAVVDPLSFADLSPFFEILQNPEIVKVFHAGRQDIEILYNLTGHTPKNVFDTQIAAAACGFNENISYGNLVKEISHVELDKSCRLTDWSLRPLDKEQLEYAACDVTYLVDCYKYLKDYMQKNNRENWINEEIAFLCDENGYCVKPEEAWHRIKHSVHSQAFLSALKYLAQWREKRAQKFNIPRSSILKDDGLINIASRNPHNIDELKQVRNLKYDVINGKLGEEILSALEEARLNPLSAKECRDDRKQEVHVPNHEQSLMEILKLLLKIKCVENGVAPKFVATEEDLRDIILNNKESKTLHGWRYEIFGQFAQLLCKGQLVLTYSPKHKNIEFKQIDNI